MAVTNLSKVRWKAPLTNTDGSPFTAAQYAGFTLYFLNADGSVKTSVAVPAAWSAANAYEMPLSDLSLTPGQYRVAMSVTNTAGLESDRTAPVAFTLASKPGIPTDLSVA